MSRSNSLSLVSIGVKHRENLRFARTKLFGVFRNLFRAVGNSFVKMELLNDRQVIHFVITIIDLCVSIL